MFFLIFLSLLNMVTSSMRLIEFNSRNLITFRGPIQGLSTTNWINQMNDRDPDTDTIYIYLSSPGGSVLEGNKLIDQIKTLELTGLRVNCIADFAASMAFVILQACPKRMALPSSVLMQHQMSLSLDGALESVNNYLDFIHQININTEKMQADRLNMTVDEFKNKVMNDWWVAGHNTKELNIVDELVMVKCSKELLNKRDKIVVRTFFGNINLIFSKCPIAREPIEIDMSHIAQSKWTDAESSIKEYLPSLYISEYHKTT